MLREKGLCQLLAISNVLLSGFHRTGVGWSGSKSLWRERDSSWNSACFTSALLEWDQCPLSIMLFSSALPWAFTYMFLCKCFVLPPQEQCSCFISVSIVSPGRHSHTRGTEAGVCFSFTDSPHLLQSGKSTYRMFLLSVPQVNKMWVGFFSWGVAVDLYTIPKPQECKRRPADTLSAYTPLKTIRGVFYRTLGEDCPQQWKPSAFCCCIVWSVLYGQCLAVSLKEVRCPWTLSLPCINWGPTHHPTLAWDIKRELSVLTRTIIECSLGPYLEKIEPSSCLPIL